MSDTFLTKLRLVIMNFLEYAVWGAWLISLGAYLGSDVLQFSPIQIGSFFATMGIASLFTPALFGIIADKWIPEVRLTSLCHIMAGAFMIVAAQQTTYEALYACILLSVCFYMPTLGLTNSVAYTILGENGLDTVRHFPPIRVFGTVGFIIAMICVDAVGFKTGPEQLYVSAGLSFALALYMFTFPTSRKPKSAAPEQQTLKQRLGLEAFELFKDRQMAIFFLFCMGLGICLQITNGFANDYLTNHFGSDPQYANAFGVQYSGTLISLSQISEAICILLIPFFLKRYGIKVVMIISFMAWVLRFAFLGLGNPGSGVWLLVLSMLVYGVAFDFFNISGSLYVDKQVEPRLRSSAQGLFLMMTNGFGSFIGSYAAGYVVRYFGYPHSWFVFSSYALVITILFYFLFKNESSKRTAATAH